VLLRTVCSRMRKIEGNDVVEVAKKLLYLYISLEASVISPVSSSLKPNKFEASN
jgi:uncharacterized hydantoinase/oxoprolinase family protein